MDARGGGRRPGPGRVARRRRGRPPRAGGRQRRRRSCARRGGRLCGRRLARVRRRHALVAARASRARSGPALARRRRGAGPPRGARAALRRHARVAARVARARVVPARAEGGRAGRAGRARRARGHADGRREEPLLPAARARERGPDRRRLAADRADARSGPAADGPRSPRGDARLRRGQSGRAQRHPHRPRDRRLRRARALRQHRVPQRDQPAADRAVRRRRGALRVRVGPRLPPGLPAPGEHHLRARPPAHDGLHRDRHAEGRGGDRRPGSACAARSGCAPGSTARTSPSTSSRSTARAAWPASARR